MVRAPMSLRRETPEPLTKSPTPYHDHDFLQKTLTIIPRADEDLDALTICVA
jgi:hypothetical protein